jgi:hypothetical protein
MKCTIRFVVAQEARSDSPALCSVDNAAVVVEAESCCGEEAVAHGRLVTSLPGGTSFSDLVRIVVDGRRFGTPEYPIISLAGRHELHPTLTKDGLHRTKFAGGGIV